MQAGSRGLSVAHSLTSFCPELHEPYAVYHLLYEGVNKNALQELATWLHGPATDKQGTATDKQGPATEKEPAAAEKEQQTNKLKPLWATAAGHADAGVIRAVMAVRMDQIILRSATSCSLVDFTKNLTTMTIAEMQLVVEVAVPYLLHDFQSLGAPESLAVFQCAPRLLSHPQSLIASTFMQHSAMQTTDAARCDQLHTHPHR